MEVAANPAQTHGRRLVVASVVVLIIAAAFAYYGAVQSQSAAGSSGSITSLENRVNSLQSSNNALKSQLAALSSQDSSSGSNAVKLYTEAQASVVTVQGSELTTVNTFFGPVTTVTSVLGSGFVVGYQNSSYIVTNFHVVNGVSNLTVTFSDGNSYPARVVGSDAYSDMAVLSVGAPASEFVQLTLAGPASYAAVGESVYAIGNPFGLSGSMTYGIVSQTGRTITESTSSQVSISDIIQFSAPINPGNSGGPLLDSNGQVLGMTTAVVSNSQGLGFAIPTSTIARELPFLIMDGTYTEHPYLGITGADMNYQLGQVTKANVTYGILVESVAQGGPAAKAGIRGGNTPVVVNGANYVVGGDVIVSVNGTKVVNQDALAAYLEGNAVAGQTVALGVIRSGSQISVSVMLGSLPGS